MFPLGIEPGTFHVLGGCNNYLTETLYLQETEKNRSKIHMRC